MEDREEDGGKNKEGDDFISSLSEYLIPSIIVQYPTCT